MGISISTRALRACMGAFALCASASIVQAQSSALPHIPLDPQEPTDVRVGMAFGAAIATDGRAVFVGAPGTDGHGAVYVFKQKGGSWPRFQKLVAPAMAPGRFGEQVTGNNNGLFVTDRQGARVYWFESDGVGPFRAKAILTGGVPEFGTSVVFEGCTAFVGSGGGSSTGPGYVHVYNRCPSGAWIYKGSFTAPDAQSQDRFGFSLAFTGTELIVGAPGRDNFTGAAYRYVFTPGSNRTNWKFVQKITQSHAGVGNRFGWSASFRNGLAAVSAPNTNNAGEVSFYKRDASNNWTLNGALTLPDIGFDAYGHKVIVTPDRVFISTNMNPFSLKIPGSVYVYRRGSGDVLTLEEHLAQDFPDDTNFAGSYDTSGRALVIGESRRFIGPFQQGGGADLYVLPN